MRRWALPVLVGLAIVTVIGVWGFGQYRERIVLENDLNNRYQMSFYNLIGRVQNMEVLLAKTLAVAGQPDDTVIFSEIWLQSEGARENLTQLPLSAQLVGRTAKFLAQSGDYARVMARQINNGESLTAEEQKTLNSLYRQAGQLNKELHDMEIKVSDGRLSISELVRAARQDLPKGRPIGTASSFQSIDQGMQGYPTLIYDGPFSDHLDRTQPVGLRGKDVTADEARNTLRKFVDAQDNSNYRAQVTGRSRERIPGYLVDLLPVDKGGEGRVSAGVSEKGGQVIWYLNSRNIGAPRLNVEQARKKAERFLEARGYKNMVNIYHQLQNNRVVFNFTPEQEGVIIYPDQVKVTVALDDGQVVGFDGRGYLMAHKERKIPMPEISADQARSKASRRMKITGTRLAMIPTDSGQEKFSYEISGQINEEPYLVYVNAITGKTDQVLKLIQSSNGTLTM